jgi:hypothetical protein
MFKHFTLYFDLVFTDSVWHPTRNIFNITFYTTSEFKMFRGMFQTSSETASKIIYESDTGLPEDDNRINSRVVSCIK